MHCGGTLDLARMRARSQGSATRRRDARLREGVWLLMWDLKRVEISGPACRAMAVPGIRRGQAATVGLARMRVGATIELAANEGAADRGQAPPGAEVGRNA
jgi:hypothetical protein